MVKLIVMSLIVAVIYYVLLTLAYIVIIKITPENAIKIALKRTLAFMVGFLIGITIIYIIKGLPW